VLDEMSSIGLGRDCVVEQFVICLTVWDLPTFSSCLLRFCWLGGLFL